MATVSYDTFFNAPQQQVWDIVSDWRNADKRIDAITNIDVEGDGPVGKGTVVSETRVMFKKEHTEQMTITEWVPPSHYKTECQSCGCKYISTVRCAPDGNGTRVEMSFEAQPLTLGAKVMSGLMGWMMKGACRKAFAKDLEDLRPYIEGDAELGTQPA